MSRKVVLRADGLSKFFYRPTQIELLKEVSLELFEGESLAIMGPSGEGKSTLLHILGTLEPFCSGKLEILGKQVRKTTAPSLRNKHIGFVFQSFNLLEEYSVLQNVLMPAHIGRQETCPGSTAHKRACKLLEQVGLEKRMHFNTKLLSGGEKQRVALARALCNDPELILADEPSGNLDHVTSHSIHELLIHCVKEFNKALIVVTHNSALAMRCDRQLTLCDGHLIPGLQEIRKQ